MLTSHVPLAGVRVVEVATHVFAPMAGAILAEWGADVLKVEPPGTGDPYRGLVTTGLHPLQAGVDPYVQSANRGKRSLVLDFSRQAGGIVAGNEKLLAEIVWPHFWAVQIILFMLIVMYCTTRELIRVIGKEKVLRMFFGPMPLPAF